MASRETENNAYAKFGVTKKEHYGMLWYFLEWSICTVQKQNKAPSLKMAVDPTPPNPLPQTNLVPLCLVFCLSLLLKQIRPSTSIQRNSVKATILFTLVGTVGIFCALPMLVCASWLHRSKKFNTGRERAQRFVAIWFLHRVSQLNLTRIVVMHRICVPALPTFC